MNPVRKEVKDKIKKIFEFFKPEYLNVFIWSFFIRLIKQTWDDIRKINGNISNNNDGEFIKDNMDGRINIVNASKIDGELLVKASITELDKDFNVKRHIETEKIDISKNKWQVFNPKIFYNNKKDELDLIYFKSNFDYERIQSLFSNLSSLSILELIQLKRNYNMLNLSTNKTFSNTFK